MERKPQYILLLKKTTKNNKEKNSKRHPATQESRDRSTGCKTHEVIFALLSTASVAPADRDEVTRLQKYVGQFGF